MAIAATPITRNRTLLDLIQQIVSQQTAVDIYRRLLALNELSGSMSASSSTEALRNHLTEHFRIYLPNESVRLCLKDGDLYKKIHISGHESTAPSTTLSLNQDLAGSVMKSAIPLWIPDTRLSLNKQKRHGLKYEIFASSIMILPFTVDGKILGCLEMLSNVPNRFDEVEYHLGLLLAGHIASAIEILFAKQELEAANARLRDHDLQLTELNEQLQQLAHTDELTGLFNKRRLTEHLEMEVARAKRYEECFSCMMVDIDDFKKINDNFGHPAGDEVLRQTGKLLRRSLRMSDFVARYGGEEFTIILPHTNDAGAYRVAENLCLAFKSHEFKLPSVSIYLTVSIGVACYPGVGYLDVQQIISQADTALYHAKRNGKDQFCFNKESDSAYHESGFCQRVETGLTQESLSNCL
jgi:diguanylate cyclase (GGDEF)-like protein